MFYRKKSDFSKYLKMQKINLHNNGEPAVLVHHGIVRRWRYSSLVTQRHLSLQGRRNDFGIGGGGATRKFFLIILFFKRIQFCSLVYLWFPISTDLLTYFGHISIHWSICRCFYNLKFFGLPKYWGGGQLPPPAPPCSYGHALLLAMTYQLLFSMTYDWYWYNINFKAVREKSSSLGRASQLS